MFRFSSFTHLFQIFIFFFIFSPIRPQNHQILPIGQAPLTTYSSAKGDTTYYIFHFSLPNPIKANAMISLEFPAEFSTGLISSSAPECGYMSPGYIAVPCQIVDRTFKLSMGVLPSGTYEIIVGQVVNPSNYESSSSFKIRTYQSTGLIDYNENLGGIAFSDPPTSLASAGVYVYGAAPKISLGTPYRFTFTLNTAVGSGNSVRITYPEGYTSAAANCIVDGVVGPAPKTFIQHNNRTYVCKNIAKTLLNEAIVMNQVISPPFSGVQRGFMIEILQGTSPIVLQRMSFNGDIMIAPGTPSFKVAPDLLFKDSYATYTFTINLVNRVDQNGALFINFTSDWNLYSQNCSIKQGGVSFPNSPISCELISGNYAYKISGFSSFERFPNIVVDIPLFSPLTQAEYLILFSSFDFKHNAIIDLTSATVAINSTYGTIHSFKPHVQISPIKLPAGQSGPLEIIFFLNYELPPTNGVTEGKFIIDIYPQIPLPTEVLYGKVKCFFFYTVISGNDGCTTSYDVTSDPTRTRITVYTPELRSFKESEIPLTITTSGPATGYNAGILIDSLIKRYLFQIRTFVNGAGIPTEVFFCDWIPDYLTIPTSDLTITPLIHEVNEWNYLKVTHVIQHDLPSPRDYVFKLSFSHISTAWASKLGYSTYNAGDLIPFPCWATSTLSADPYISCDLIVGTSASPFSYIYVYGFAAVSQSVVIEIHLPKILNGPNVGFGATITFEVMEETWAQVPTYVTLYQKTVTVFTTVAQSFSSFTTNTGFTITTPDSTVVDTASSYVFSYTAPSIVTYAIVQVPTPPSSYVNSMIRGSPSCPTGICVLYDLNTHWILFTPTTPTTAITFTIPTGNLQNGVWVETQPFYIRLMDGSGNIISKIQNTKTTSSAPITTITFDKDSSETALYMVSEHLFDITWTSIKTMPAGGSITLTFSGISQQASDDFYCLTSGLTVLSTNSVEGISCSSISSTTILINNVDIMASSNSITVYLRLVTGTSTTAALVKVQTWRDSLHTELVEESSGTTAVATAVSSVYGLQDFKVNSPITTSTSSMHSQVVPIVLSITPTSNAIAKIKVTFPSGFSNPSQLTLSDAPYCLLVTTRVACTYTTSPLIYVVSTTGLSISTAKSVTLSTIYTNPLNGILQPSTPGYYNIQVDLTDSSGNTIEQNTQYIFVAPDILAYFDVRMAHRTSNTENFFIFSIKTTNAVNAYNAGTNPGKIHIIFPKYANDGLTLAFASDLDTGLSASGIIPCSFTGLTALTGLRLQCRLIPGNVGTSTDIRRVEVINFAAISAATSFEVRIAKITNPSLAVQDVNMKIHIFEVKSDGSKLFIHQDTFNLFMNIDTVHAPDLTDYPIPSESLVFTISPVVDSTADSLSLKIYSHTNDLNAGDFFITYLPSSLSGLSDNILGSCVATVKTCYSFPDANMVIYEMASTITALTTSPAPITPLNVFTSIPQSPVSFYSNVIQNQIYTHRVQHIYAQTDLNNLIGAIPSATITTVSTKTLPYSRKKTEVLVSFTVTHPIPSTGSIEIRFPSDYPTIYGGCRSYVTASTPSVLTSPIGSKIGGISCYLVNGGKSWYISGFAAVAANSFISIYGLVDLPSTTPTTLKIYSYANQDTSNIVTAGQYIDQITTGVILTVGTTSPLTPDGSWTFNTFDVLRVSTLAPLSIFFQVSTAISTSPQISLLLKTTDQIGAYTYTWGSSNTSYSCILKQISNSLDIPCQVSYANATSTFTFIVYSTILASQDYQLTLTTLYQANDANGIKYPSQAGVYMAILTLSSGGTTLFSDARYLEIYPAAFSSIAINAYNLGTGLMNPISVSITPSSTLTTSNFIIIELPTRDSAGNNLFPNDGGLGITYDVESITYDEKSSSTYLSSCNGYLGDQSTGKPAKIVCGIAASTVLVSNTIKFVFLVKNPITSTSLTIPLLVYAMDASYKVMFDYIEKGIYVIPTVSTTTTPPAISFSPKSIGSSSSLTITYPGAYTLKQNQDFFIIQLAFQPPAITSVACTTVSSAACLYDTLVNLKLIVIYPGSSGISTGVITLTGFTNPNHLLTSTEIAVSGWSLQNSNSYVYEPYTYPSIDISSVLTPLVAEITLTTSKSSFATLEVGHQSQYIFAFTVSAAWTSVIKTILFQLPTSITIIYQDCFEDQDSLAEISYCNIDSTSNLMTINIYDFHGGKLTIKTREKGVINPGTPAGDVGSFIIRAYNSINPSYSSDEGLVYKNTFNSQLSTVNSYGLATEPYYIKVDDLPYQDEIYAASAINYYFWIKFRIIPTTAVASLSIKTVTTEISIPTTPTTLKDVKDSDLLCLIDEVRYFTCSISVSGLITITSISLTSGTTYRVTIGLVNLYHTNPAISGFYPTSSTNYQTSFQVNLYDSSNNLVNYGENRRSIIQEKMFITATVSFMTSVTGKTNVLTFSLKDSTGLIDTLLFEFPTVSDQGTAIFKPDLGDFLDGGEFPCESTKDITSRTYCYIKHGYSTNLGYPTYVVMRGFAKGTTAVNYILAGFTNPIIDGTFVSIKVYGYQQSDGSLHGFMEFNNIFMTVPSTTITIHTVPDQFTIETINEKATASMTSQVLIPANKYILIEDLSTKLPSFELNPSTSNPVCKKLHGIKSTSTGRLVYWIVSFSSAITANTAYQFSNAIMKIKSDIVKFHHYSSDGVTGEIVTTNTITSATATFCDGFAYSSLELASNDVIATNGIATLTIKTCFSSATFNFVDGNILEITLINFVSSSITSCYVLDGLTPSYAYVPISCVITNSGSTVLSITGWNGVSTSSLRLFLGFTNDNLGGTTGFIKVKAYYNSQAKIDDAYFVSSDSSTLSWPTASQTERTTLISNLVVNIGTSPYSLDFQVNALTTSVVSNIQTIYITFSSSIYITATSLTLATSYYFTVISGNSNAHTSFAAATISSNVLTLTLSSSLAFGTFIDYISVHLEFNTLNLANSVFNIAFLYFQISDFTYYEIQSIVTGIQDISPVFTLSSLSTNPSTPTEIVLAAVSNINFVYPTYDIILLELGNDWSFDLTTTANDFPIPCISSSDGISASTALTCYGHKASITGFPLNSITIHLSGFITNLISSYYISKLKIPSSTSSSIAVKYIKSGSIVVLSSAVSASVKQIFAIADLGINLGSTATIDTGTLTLAINGLSSGSYPILYTSNSFTSLTLTYTLGSGIFMATDIIYIDFGDFSSMSTGSSNWGGVTANRFYTYPSSIIVEPSIVVSSVDVTTNSKTFTSTSVNVPAYKIFEGGYIINAYIYRSNTQISSAATTAAIAENIIDGNKIVSVAFTNDNLFISQTVYTQGFPTMMIATFTVPVLPVTLTTSSSIVLKLLKTTYSTVITAGIGCTVYSDRDSTFLSDPLRCTFDSTDATYYFMTITSSTIIIPTATIFNILFPVSNFAFSSNILLDVFYSYGSSTNYIKVGSINTISGNTPSTVSASSYIPLDKLYFYPCYTNQYLGAAATFNPIRIRFQLSSSSGTAFSSSGTIEITFSATLTKPSPPAIYKCYFKKFDISSTKYTTHYVKYYPSTDCTLLSSTLTVYPPDVGLEIDSLYELVIAPKTSPAYTNSIGVTFTDNLVLDIKFISLSSTYIYYSSQTLWKYRATAFNGNFRLNSLYITTKEIYDVTHQKVSSMLFQFIFPAISNYPLTYMEIEFPTTFTMFPNILVSGKASNSEHPCYLSTTFTTQSVSYQSPRCILIYGNSATNKPSVIRIQNFNAQTLTTNTFTVSVEDIMIAGSTLISSDLRVLVYSYSFAKWYRYFLNLYDAFLPISAASLSSTLSDTFTLSNGFWGFSTDMQGGSTQTWFPSSFVNNDKLLIKIPSSMGPYISNFGSLIPTIDSHPHNLLYINTKNYYILISLVIGSSITQKATVKLSSPSVQLPIYNSFNLPQTVDCLVYRNLIYSNLLTINLNSGQLNYKVATTSFVSSASADTSFSPPGKLSLAFYTFSMINIDISITSFNMFKVTVSSGTFQKCYLTGYICEARSDGLYIRPQKASSSNSLTSLTLSIVYSNAGGTPPASLLFTLYYLVNGVIYYEVSQTSATIGLKTFSTSFDVPSLFQLNYKNGLSDYYQPLIPLVLTTSTALIQPLRISLTLGESLDYNDIIKITRPTVITNSLTPTPTILYCTIQNYINDYQLSISSFSQSCLYVDPLYTFTIPRVGTAGIASGSKQLITIKGFSSGSGINIPQIDARYEVALSVEHPGGTNVQSDVVYLTPPPIASATFLINHMSQTINQYDHIEITFTLNSALLTDFKSTLTTTTFEMLFYLEFDSIYYPTNLGFSSTSPYEYTSSSTLLSGDRCDHYINLASTGKSTLVFGDSYGTNPRVLIPIHDVFTSSPTTLTVPMIYNPSSINKPLNIKLIAVEYLPNQAYPIVLFYYNLKNHAFTTTLTIPTLTINSLTAPMIQQTSQTLSITISSSPSVTLILNSVDRIAVRITNGYKSSSFSSATVSSGFQMIYFSISNIYLIQPTTTSTPLSISLSGLSTFDYSDVISIEVLLFYQNNFYGKNTQTSSTMATLTSQIGAISLIEGLTNYNSQGLYLFTFTSTSPFTIPNLGVIEINLPATLVPITSFGLGDYCRVNVPSNEGINTDLTSNVIYCYQKSSTIYHIQGFGIQGTTVTLNIHLYLTVKATSGNVSPSSIVIYGDINTIYKVITLSISASSPIISGTSHLNSLSISNGFPQYIYANQWGPLSFTFKTTSGAMQYANGAILELTLPTEFTLASGGSTKIYAKYGPASGNSYVTLIPTVSGQVITIPIQNGYPIPVNTDYTLIIYTVLSTTNNGILRPNPYLYTFILDWKDGTTLKELGRYDYKVLPQDDTLGSVSVLNIGISQKTIIEFTFNPNLAITSSNFAIYTQFITYDGFNQVFPDDLGLGLTTQKAQAMSCSEPIGSTVISSTRIACVLWKGDFSNNIPATLKIPITTAISSSSSVNYYLAYAQNPSLSNYLTGTVIQVTQKCRNDGLMCVYYESYTTYTTSYSTSPSFNYDTTFNPIRSISLSNSLIYTTGVTHTLPLKFAYAVTSGSYLVISYPSYNMIVSDTCTASTETFCMTFPLVNWILVKLASSISAGTSSTTPTYKNIVITNARYVDTLNGPILVDVWSGANQLRIDSQQYDHPSYSPFVTTAIRPITLTITPTRTTPLNYWLKNFMNYATLTANGIWYNSEITWFKLIATSSLSYFSSGSCNASLTLGAPLRNNPYPARLLCSVAGSNLIHITQNPNYPFPSFINNFKTWQLSINFNFWITASPPSSSITFYIYGCAVATTDTYISLGQITINIDPYLQPQFSVLTFNTNSFYDRIGLPGGKVEFYMLLRPSTLVTDYDINKLVFTIPNDFGYPAVPTLNCEMIGATNYTVSSCQEQRIGGRTLVTLVPSIYLNEVKIVRLTYYLGNTGLFTVPLIGGNNYVLQVDMYDNNQLVERGKANISEIYPGTFNIAGITIEPSMDASTYGLLKVTFQVGSNKIPQGYNMDSFPYYSNIVLIFQNKDGYENTLGTNQANNTPINCAPGTGIYVTYKKRLSCNLKIGTNSEDLPEIQIFDYDDIAANAVVTLYIANLQTLPLGLTATISLAARLYYRTKYGIVYLYKPIDYLPVANTVFNAIGAVAGSVTTTGAFTVLSTNDYAFTFTLTTTIGISDYFAIKFPLDMFDRYAESYSQVSTDIAGEAYVFPISNYIYFQPSALMSGSQTLTIKNLINPGYATTDTIIITGWSVVSNKVKNQFTFPLVLNVQKCSIFSSFIQVSSSLYSSQNNVTMSFTFITGHNIPTNGGIRITLASDSSSNCLYGNLAVLQATCTLIGFDKTTICIVSPNDIYVSFQGVSIDKSKNYTISLSGINTPSIAVDSYKNTITTYFDGSSSKIICQQSYSVPSLKVIPINSCQMEITLEYHTMGQTSNYYFALGCNGVLRDSTIIEIALPVEFGYNDGDIIQCTSDNNILTSNECVVDLHSQPNILLIKAYADGFGSYSGLVLQMKNIQNPILTSSPYILKNIQAYFYSYSTLYGQTTNQYYISYSNTISSITGQIYFNRLIFNADEPSTYFFTIYKPVQSTTPITTISIQFPDNFIEGLGQSISCGGYLTASPPFKSALELIKYEDWKKFIYQGTYDTLDCSVDQKKLNLNNVGKYAMNNTFFVNIFINNIVNPSQTSPQSKFSVIYSYSNRIDWINTVTEYISVADKPNIIQIANITLSDYNVRRSAEYKFTIKFTNGNFLNSYLSPLISLELPHEYTQVLASQQSFNCFNSLFLNKNLLPTCNIYGLEILTEPYPMNNKNKAEFDMTYKKLINPNIKTSCSNQNSVSQLFASYNIKLIDVSNNNIIAKNYPALDIINCVEFKQNAYVVYLQYHTNMLIGLTYQINVILESPADGVTYVPKLIGADTSNIVLNPVTLIYTNYTTTNLSFTISSSFDANEGEYTLHSDIYERTPLSFYLPILDQTIRLIKPSKMAQLNDPLLQKAMITFDNTTTIDIDGNAVNIDVLCSQIPGDTVFLDISYNSTILAIYPTRLTFNSINKNSSFSIKVIQSNVKNTWQIVNFSLSIANQFISQQDIPFTLQQNSKNFTLKKFDKNYALEVFGIKQKAISHNIANFDVYTSKKCKIYYILTYYGSPAPSQSQIYNNTYSKSVISGNMNSQSVYNVIVDYIAEINFNGLEGNSRFMLYVIAQDIYNITDITSIDFKTKALSFSWAIKMNFLENVTLTAVINALSLTLRLPTTRFVLLSDHKVNDVYVPKIMKPRPVIYEILIAPDPFNDEIKPRYYAQLMATNTYIMKFKAILSQFNEVKGIYVYEYRLNPPLIQRGPIKLWAKYYEMLISVITFKRCKIYAIRILNNAGDNSLMTPLSQQIYKGMNPYNDYLNKTPYYVFKGVTDQNGYIEINMTDLFDGYTYDVYITAGNNYPYEPPLLLADSDVQHIRVTTPINKNVKGRNVDYNITYPRAVFN